MGRAERVGNVNVGAVRSEHSAEKEARKRSWASKVAGAVINSSLPD